MANKNQKPQNRKNLDHYETDRCIINRHKKRVNNLPLLYNAGNTGCPICFKWCRERRISPFNTEIQELFHSSRHFLHDSVYLGTYKA